MTKNIEENKLKKFHFSRYPSVVISTTYNNNTFFYFHIQSFQTEFMLKSYSI